MLRPSRTPRITLDGQLVGYWDREAARLEAIAATTRFAWQKRRLLRKAAEARAKAERSRRRETERGQETPPAEA
ncbi:hypothetical protein [Methylobacterium sp. E-066]|uniref:hypothetical protein n=1 Tax=Methylobacterium sp. E-066 TaxID=2836584 RepID=UPI001FBA5C2D|nr:hypothetical protein [Methylobacterium sp. E-066]MCJ2139805.1 hypothetical protein [Methylobacterium sp. E-066]